MDLNQQLVKAVLQWWEDLRRVAELMGVDNNEEPEMVKLAKLIDSVPKHSSSIEAKDDGVKYEEEERTPEINEFIAKEEEQENNYLASGRDHFDGV